MKKALLVALLSFIAFSDVFCQNNSQYISQVAPAAVNANEIFNVSVTFKNIGTSTWTTGNNFMLGTQSPQDNTVWGVGRVALPNSVSPGQQVTFNIILTAPSSGDGYGTPLQWKMLQDGVAWFGDPSELIPIIVGGASLPDSLLHVGTPFSVANHIVATSMFHWYGATTGQLSGPWVPLEGRENWTGDVPFWKTMIKQAMAANIDVFYVLVIPSTEQERINLFKALNELRREGWDVPKVCPFFDPQITYEIFGYNGNAATVAGKDEIVSHYIRFYQQYYSVNFDQYADDYIYTLDNIPVLDVWHVEIKIDNHEQLTRADVSSRLSAEFGAEHPIFNNGIRLVATALSSSFGFADEKVHQFEVHEYYIEKVHNSIVSSQIKPGYWDQNVRNPGFLLPRNGGIQYTNAWAQLSPAVSRVYIESFNEYDEGSGIYAARTDTIYKKTDGGMNNTGNDTWSSTNDPYHYIKATASGAANFNNVAELDAKILWHNIPTTMMPGETITASVVVRNAGDTQWNASNNFKLGQQEFVDPVLFGSGRYILDDSQDEIPEYGGIFRGRTTTFNIDITAPASIGSYNTHWSMLQEGVVWFGEVLDIPITVTSASTTNNSSFVSQNIPANVITGEDFLVTMTFENTGSTTWDNLDPNKVFLGSENPQNNVTWGTNQILLQNAVAPGQQITLSATMTAPAVAGDYNFQWRLSQEGVEWFGELSTNVPISVASSALVDNSTFISQVVPTTVYAGEVFNVSVTFENVGTTTWSASDSYELGTQNPQNNTFWGVGTRLALPQDVLPGGQVTFSVNLTAPQAGGDLQWQMVQNGVEWFGDLSTNAVINVAVPVNNSSFISQVAPSTVYIGQEFNVSVTFQNTGTTIWRSSAEYKLGTQNPQDNTIWGIGTRVALPNDVFPGGQVMFTATLTAPQTTSNLQWKMVQDGVEWFGAVSDNVIINIPAPVNDSQFISQDVPTTVYEGEVFSASVTFENTGTTIWKSSDSYSMGSQSPRDNTNWGVNRVALPNDVLPGDQVTIVANLTAPNKNKKMQWKMVQDGVEWFGETSDQLSITVNPDPGARIGESTETSAGDFEEDGFVIYPNPVSSSSSIQISGLFHENDRIILLNFLGAKISEKVILTEERNVTLDLTGVNLSNGSYVIQIRSQGLVITKNLLVDR